jgi:hypothetical protein
MCAKFTSFFLFLLLGIGAVALFGTSAIAMFAGGQ